MTTTHWNQIAGRGMQAILEPFLAALNDKQIPNRQKPQRFKDTKMPLFSTALHSVHP